MRQHRPLIIFFTVGVILHFLHTCDRFTGGGASAWHETWSPEAQDPNSIVDYLKFKKQPSSTEARKALFEKRFPGQTYKGTAEQNTHLLHLLVAEDKEALVAAADAKKRLQAAPSKPPEKGERLVTASAAFPCYVPAAGFGINASYAANANVRVTGTKVTAANFAISIDSASAQLGTLQFTGTVEIFVADGKIPAKTFALQKAWFQTIGPAGATAAYMYAKEGTEIDVPANTKVIAHVSMQPTVSTKQGLVALCAKSFDVSLGK